MELLGKVLALLPAALALVSVVPVLVRLRRDRALGVLALLALAIQAPVSLAGYLAVLELGPRTAALVLSAGGGLVAGAAIARLAVVVRSGRRRVLRRLGWLPAPTALSVAAVQTSAVLTDAATVRVCLAVLAGVSGVTLGAAISGLARLLVAKPRTEEPTAALLPAPTVAAVLAGAPAAAPPAAPRQTAPPATGPSVTGPSAPLVAPATTPAATPAATLPTALPMSRPTAPPMSPPTAPAAPAAAGGSRRRGGRLALLAAVAAGALLGGTAVFVVVRDQSAPGTTTPPTALTGALAWRVRAGADELLPPAVLDGTVLIGDAGGRLRAVAAETGEALWTRTLPGDMAASPSVSGDAAYIVSGTTVFRIDPRTGADLWRYRTASFNAFPSPPIAVGDLVVTATDTRLYALDSVSGTLAWQVATAPSESFTGLPAVAGEQILIPTEKGLAAFAAGTGAVAWRFAAGPREGVWAGPALSPTTAFVALGGRIVALDLFSGTVRWSFAPTGEDQLNESPALLGDRLIATDGRVYALDADTGSEVWSSTAVDAASGSAVTSTPVIAGGDLLIPLGDGLAALDANDGSLRWRTTTGPDRFGVGIPAVAGAQAVVLEVGMDGSLARGLDLGDGTERWRIAIPGEAYLTAPTGSAGIVLLPGREVLLAVR